MRIGLIVAMEKEFVQLRRLLTDSTTECHNRQDFVRGSLCSHEVIMMQCGIGKVNAAMGATRMIDVYHPEMVISTGVAGGADTAMEVTDVVISTALVYHDMYCGKECDFGQVLGMPSKFVTPSHLVEKALALSLPHSDGQRLADGGNRVEPAVHAGLIVTGDWFVDSKEKMREILAHFPEAKAVDMESCAIAQVCHQNDTPFVSFRIISDIPLKDTDASQYFDFWNRLANGSFHVTKRFLESI